MTTEIQLRNLPPDASPLLAPFSALGLEVSSDSSFFNASWVNASSASLGAARGSVRLTSALPQVRQVRYLWSDTPCLGWNSTTERPELGQWRCPLYTSGGLPVLPFLLNATSARLDT